MVLFKKCIKRNTDISRLQTFRCDTQLQSPLVRIQSNEEKQQQRLQSETVHLIGLFFFRKCMLNCVSFIRWVAFFPIDSFICLNQFNRSNCFWELTILFGFQFHVRMHSVACKWFENALPLNWKWKCLLLIDFKTVLLIAYCVVWAF